jgi:hypothetical protein
MGAANLFGDPKDILSADGTAEAVAIRSSAQLEN